VVKLINFLNKVILIICLIVSTACTTTPVGTFPEDNGSGNKKIPPVDTQKPVQSSIPTVGESALKLLEKARRQAESGQGELAAATLERAIKIEPENPWLWHRLAVLRMQQKKWSQAVELANRSIALANGNQRLIGGNWLVISLALEGAGSYEAAAKAKKKSDVYLGEE